MTLTYKIARIVTGKQLMERTVMYFADMKYRRVRFYFCDIAAFQHGCRCLACLISHPKLPQIHGDALGKYCIRRPVVHLAMGYALSILAQSKE